jgi:F0F1-type ATP synthase epsilon subunit
MFVKLRAGAADATQQVVDMVTVAGSAGVLAGTAPTIANVAVPFPDLTAAATAHNALLTALRTRGVIA